MVAQTEVQENKVSTRAGTQSAFALTAEYRRKVCVHEAAHAVIAALGGTFVYEIAVAPLGAEEWTWEGGMSGPRNDLRGACSTSDIVEQFLMEWSWRDGCYLADMEGYRQLHSICSPGLQREGRRILRAYICLYLAGPIADEIYEGVEQGCVCICPLGISPAYDEDKAFGLSLFLRGRSVCYRMGDETERQLRKPEIWGKVIRLAGELETKGVLGNDELIPFLPEPVKNWPPARIKA